MQNEAVAGARFSDRGKLLHHVRNRRVRDRNKNYRCEEHIIGNYRARMSTADRPDRAPGRGLAARYH
jgi:hypothetical protein